MCIRDRACTVPDTGKDAKADATKVVTGDKIGELAPGQSIECVGILTGIKVDQVKDCLLYTSRCV